jgi:hypothetical protein
LTAGDRDCCGRACIRQRVVVPARERHTQELQRLPQVERPTKPALDKLSGASEVQGRHPYAVTGTHRENGTTIEVGTIGDELSNVSHYLEQCVPDLRPRWRPSQIGGVQAVNPAETDRAPYVNQ